MSTHYKQGKALMFQHDQLQVRELRLAAAVLQDTSAMVNVVDLLERAAERIEFLSVCAADVEERRRREQEHGRADAGGPQ